MTTIYSEIKSDHDTHRKLLKQIEDATDNAERGKHWDRFYYDVKAHAAAEEETFYSKLMARPDGQDDARHSVAEHKALDDLMEELNDMGPSDKNWANRFDKLKHDYEHHMEEEEADIFSQAKELFDESDAKKFAVAFKDRKSAERKLVDEKAEASLET